MQVRALSAAAPDPAHMPHLDAADGGPVRLHDLYVRLGEALGCRVSGTVACLLSLQQRAVFAEHEPAERTSAGAGWLPFCLLLEPAGVVCCSLIWQPHAAC